MTTNDTELHPDTRRLMHILEFDHDVAGEEFNPDTDTILTTERITFIYDGEAGANPLQQLRAAIDNSMSAHRRLQQRKVSHASHVAAIDAYPEL